MLKTKIELVPFGVGEPRTLATAEIWRKPKSKLKSKVVRDYGFKIFKANSKDL